MFGLLVGALARVSLDQDPDNTSVLDGLVEAIFDTCQHIERWNRQRRAVDMRAVLKCASWISNAFANPAVDEEVVIQWKQDPDHTNNARIFESHAGQLVGRGRLRMKWLRRL